MKKKAIIFFVFIVVVVTFFISYIGIDKYENYTGERGTMETGRLVTCLQQAYDRNIFRGLSTIACNDEYGSFIFKVDGKFYYFPKEKNILNNNNNIYYYMGYWYYDYTDSISLTILRTYFNNSFLKVRFKEKQYRIPFDYVNSEEYKYSDDLLIDNKVFKLLDNMLTIKSKQKLRLDENIINQYLLSK